VSNSKTKLNFQRVIFFYPSKTTGGVELLFFRLAKQCNESEVPFGVIDYTDGFLPRKLASDNINFSSIDASSEDNFFLNQDDIIVTPLSMLSSELFKKIDTEGCKIIFWDLHPFNLIEQTAFSKFYKKNSMSKYSHLLKVIEYDNINRLNNTIAFINDKRALYFMCKSNFDYSKNFFELKIIPTYLPILVDNKVGVKQSKVYKDRSDELNLAWLGRLDDDKICSLNLLLKDLDNFARGNNVTFCRFLIIGDGQAKNKIFKPSNFEISFLGSKNLTELDELITNHIDIGFAVGTSCLEFAIRKVPSVMLPNPSSVSFFRLTNNKFAMLNDSKNYEICVEPYFCPTKLVSLEDILCMDLKESGLKCFEYYKENHDINAVFSKFMHCLNNSSLLVSDFKRITEPSLVTKSLLRLKSLVKSSL